MNVRGWKHLSVKLTIWIFRAIVASIIVVVAGVITELVAIPIAEQISLILPCASATLTVWIK